MSYKQKNDGWIFFSDWAGKEGDKSRRERKGENFMKFPDLKLPRSLPYLELPSVTDESDMVHSCPGLQFEPELKKANHLGLVSNKPIRSFSYSVAFLLFSRGKPENFSDITFL